MNIFLYDMVTDNNRGGHGSDRMVVGFTTTCAISAYHHLSCEFESHSWVVRLTTTCAISDYHYFITKVVSLNPTLGDSPQNENLNLLIRIEQSFTDLLIVRTVERCTRNNTVLKFISNLLQVGGFLLVL